MQSTSPQNLLTSHFTGKIIVKLHKTAKSCGPPPSQAAVDTTYSCKANTSTKKIGQTANAVRPIKILCNCAIVKLLSAIAFDISVYALCDDLNSRLVILNVVDNGILVLESLVNGEEVRHFVKNVLRKL